MTLKDELMHATRANRKKAKHNLNLCLGHKQEWKQSHYDDHNCDYCKLEKQHAELLDALERIAEYWNRDQNETAMADACWHAVNTAEDAIAKAQGVQS